MNPYQQPAPTEEEPVVCARCKRELQRPQPSLLESLAGWLVLCLFIGLAFYGMKCLIDSCMVWNNGQRELWFEESLRRWLWGA